MLPTHKTDEQEELLLVLLYQQHSLFVCMQVFQQQLQTKVQHYNISLCYLMELNKDKILKESVFSLSKILQPQDLTLFIQDLPKLVEKKDQLDKCLQIGFPLKVSIDQSNGKPFIQLEQYSTNTEPKSYRSPWSNAYYPNQGTVFPTLLALEQKANELFEHYVALYYDRAVSSVHFIDTTVAGFTAFFCVKKELRNFRDINQGIWDTTHEVICTLKSATKQDQARADYKVNSIIHINVDSQSQDVGQMRINGTWKMNTLESVQVPQFKTQDEADSLHLKIIGRMIENNEAMLSNEAFEHYICKMRQVTNKTRSLDAIQNKKDFKTELMQAATQVKKELKPGDFQLFDGNNLKGL